MLDNLTGPTSTGIQEKNTSKDDISIINTSNIILVSINLHTRDKNFRNSKLSVVVYKFEKINYQTASATEKEKLF